MPLVIESLLAALVIAQAYHSPQHALREWQKRHGPTVADALQQNSSHWIARRPLRRRVRKCGAALSPEVYTLVFFAKAMLTGLVTRKGFRFERGATAP